MYEKSDKYYLYDDVLLSGCMYEYSLIFYAL